MNYSLTAIHQGIRSSWQYELWKIERKVTNHQLFQMGKSEIQIESEF